VELGEAGMKTPTEQLRYHLTTFGCQMNEHDSERMSGMLEALGYSEAPDRESADLILFNTCSIRESADSRFLAHLGEARRLKREQPERVVGVGGCWAQSLKHEVFERFPFVDVAFGPGQVHKLAEFLMSNSLSAQGYFEFEGFERLRYTSPHPKDMREDVVRAHAELASVCEHIHLPLQSGSSRILRAMRRTYDRRRYLDRVALIREHVPDAALTTDVIVGFPGETEEDFRETLEVVQEVAYDGAFTFIFSPRRGTEAARIVEGNVPHPVKVERMQRLVELVQRGARERAQRFVGRSLEVLVEGPSRTDPDKLRGRTRHNKVVNFSGLAAPGELAQVRIESATSQTLSGEELLLTRVGG